MTFLTEYLDSYGVDASGLASDVLKVLSEALIPKVITHSVIESYVRRALHHKIWFKLSKVERALLKAASKVVRVVRSKVLAEVLKRIFLIIELTTLKGRATYYGLLIMIRGERPKTLLSKVKQALLIGISYLNNPLIYRHLD